MRCVGGGEEAYAHLRAAALCRTVHVVGFAGKVETACEDATRLETCLHTVFHRLPDFREVGADVLALALVDEVAQLVTRLPTPTQERVHRRVVVHLLEGLLVGTLDLRQLAVYDDSAAANRVVGLLTHLRLALHRLDRHSVHVEHERLVRLPDERHLLRLQFAFDRHIRHVAFACRRERSVQNHRVAVDAVKVLAAEHFCSIRRSHGVGAGGSMPDSTQYFTPIGSTYTAPSKKACLLSRWRRHSKSASLPVK